MIQIKLLSVICIVCFLPGCAARPVQTTRNALPNSIASKLILHGDLTATRVGDLRMDNSGPFLQVQAELYNMSSTYDTIYYRFHWYNSSGMSVGSDESWKTIPILEKAMQRIKGVSTSKSAVDFKLELQSQNNTGEN